MFFAGIRPFCFRLVEFCTSRAAALSKGSGSKKVDVATEIDVWSERARKLRGQETHAKALASQLAQQTTADSGEFQVLKVSYHYKDNCNSAF